MYITHEMICRITEALDRADGLLPSDRAYLIFGLGQLASPPNELRAEICYRIEKIKPLLLVLPGYNIALRAEVSRLIDLLSIPELRECNCAVPNQIQCDVHGPRE